MNIEPRNTLIRSAKKKNSIRLKKAEKEISEVRRTIERSLNNQDYEKNIGRMATSVQTMHQKVLTIETFIDRTVKTLEIRKE